MNRRLVLLLLFTAPVCLLSTGCFGSKKPKPSNTIAADVEEEFRQRWVAKRIGDLTTSGEVTDGRKAREQALREYSEKFGYTSAGKSTSRP